MVNHTIQLPKKLYGSYNKQPEVNFDMSKTHYYINGEQFINNLGFAGPIGGYKYSVLNNTILVTIFDKEEVLD